MFLVGLRASVLLQEEDAPLPRPMALMKRAPEVVRQFLKQVGWCRYHVCGVVMLHVVSWCL
jgi:hypothetical protein